MPTPLNIFQDKEKFIDKSIKGLEGEVAVIQREMLNLILDEYIPKFTLDKEGNIANTAANTLRAATLDNVINDWNVKYQQSVLKGYTKRVFELAGYNKDYFLSLDPKFKKQVLESVPLLEKQVNAILGIKKSVIDGKTVTKLVKGGYLENLQVAESIKQQLKSYVIDSVNSNIGFKDYEKGFKSLLQKNNGLVDKYYKTFVYDTFSQIDRVESSFHAERLGLTKFIYQGSLILTSRPFCCKRAGKVFDVNDLSDWKCDVNLIMKPTGQDCDNSYRPLVELGRIRCRHGLRYISDELAERLGVTESKTIVKKQGGPMCPKAK